MGALTQRRFEDAEYERCRAAAQLYYNGDFTQEQVAAYLTISRPWVSRLLKRARELGIVSIVVEPSAERPLGLELLLARALGVSRCLIASGLQLAETAALAASYLAERLRDGDVLGLAWGKTLAATVGAFEPPARIPAAVRCVALIGGASAVRPEIDADRLVSSLAQKLQAASNVLNAPAFVENHEVQVLLMKEPGIRATLELAESTTIALMCIGGMRDSTIRELGTLSQQEFAELETLGAVGDVCQWFFDREGKHILSGPAQRMISADLALIRERARERIAVAIGPARVKAIVGAARGGWYTTLVTNLSTARALLDELHVRASEFKYSPARPARGSAKEGLKTCL
ncbi:MAG: sugar-binding transcriptional regulator [Vulcanimicrobiaceae bacterium]